MRIRNLLGIAWREPMVQFGLLGATLYLASRVAAGDGSLQIPVERLEDSRAKMSRLLERSGDAVAVRRESDLRVVGDELLYREALRLGLDRDDPVIRQHLAQKLLALTEEAALAAREPTIAEERAMFEQLRVNWIEPARIRFCHVFAGQGRIPAAIPQSAGLGDDECGGAGEAFPLGSRIGPSSQQELTDRFGAEFADAAFAAEEGRWIGPIRSRYGSHRVRDEVRIPEFVPRFEDRRATVRQAWLRRERERARSDLLRTLARRDHPTAADDASPELRHDVAQAVARMVSR